MITLTTLTQDVDNEIDIINGFFDKGLDLLYVDKPEKNYLQLMAYLSGIDEIYHNRIIVHQHHDAAEDFVLKGIHVAPKVRTSLGEDLGIYVGNFTKQSYEVSTYFSDLKEISYHRQLPFAYALVNTKNLQNSDLQLKDVKSDLHKYLATEGINMLNISLIYQMGFDGINVCEEIWNSTNPAQMFDSLYSSVMHHFKRVDN